MREECDDGNNVDGDGCSAQCTIEPEWECMTDAGVEIWGPSKCRPKCGNGIVETYPSAADPNIDYVEECDLGFAFNVDATAIADVYLHACSTTCKKQGLTTGVDLHLWKCETAVADASNPTRTNYSTCHFLCGNGYLDVDEGEPCDRLDRPWTAQTKDTEYVGAVANWHTNNTDNTALNIGCDKYCHIVNNFRCPENNDYTDPNNNLLCTDRCHDGEFDGPYPGVNRGTS